MVLLDSSCCITRNGIFSLPSDRNIYFMILIIMQNFVLIMELIVKLSLSCGSDCYSLGIL